jgi:hypothetical protein
MLVRVSKHFWTDVTNYQWVDFAFFGLEQQGKQLLNFTKGLEIFTNFFGQELRRKRVILKRFSKGAGKVESACLEYETGELAIHEEGLEKTVEIAG